ncbi:hypothetical protein B9G39_28145 [Zooshikella ganghwensis]|uniref:DegT/DnrJ/EryC1/StrS aminotransferase family protein n=1 Tax=Zooshikella ganghwensis TaxID=202772 RepID=A0A4P9VH01_9GAMM|nr:hypothetical protein B9G39_28145 [Zooshikella ganghwensis]
MGANPVYVNVDKSFNIDPKDLGKIIDSKTKAIMPVCLYGSTRNIREVYHVAKSYNLKVIIDAAQCFGIPELIDYADIVVLSFNPFKNIGTFGKSGALITQCNDLSDQARRFSYHGFYEGKKNDKCLDWGYNGRMDNIQAAVLLKKLEYFELNSLKRCFLAHRYIEKLNKIENDNRIVLPVERNENTWHLFPIILNDKKSADLIEFGKSKSVEFDVYYPILSHEFKTNYASNYKHKDHLSKTSDIHSQIIHIPLHNHMSTYEQDNIIKVIYDFFR